MNVLYHLGKPNVVVDAPNRLSMDSVTHVEEEKKELSKDVNWLACLGVCLMGTSDGGVIVQNGLESSLVKVEHQKQRGVTQEISIPTWKWKVINMDFVTSLPRTWRQHGSIWVIVDRVTKSAHFLAIKTTDSSEDYVRLYISEIKGLGTQVNLSTSFHLQMNSQAESIMQTLYDMFRAFVLDFKGEEALIRPDSVHEAMEKVHLIKDRLKTT
ncbi:hypothetical protein MTR67_039584 [Solanum verrucosum]|uniref:Integrase catalytic domain-containing protein n=1 Tax=Solanum verrucosum TaxID=315347 RepID=A0AAF0UJ78_SOLVR|nr:hypothetical protein MTR67_039584 [Solanum verrucosum]